MNPHTVKYRPTVQGQGTSTDTSTSDPVVGWVVAVEGPVKGANYTLKWGINSVGRESNDCHVFLQDETISREAYASIFYDHMSNSFYLLPIQNPRLRMVVLTKHPRLDPDPQWKPLLEKIELQPFHMMKIGKTELMFVPFCGEDFKWEDL